MVSVDNFTLSMTFKIEFYPPSYYLSLSLLSLSLSLSLSPGYLRFLGAVHGEIESLKSLPPTLPVSGSPANSMTGSQLTPTPSLGSEDKTDLGVLTNANLKNQLDRREVSPGQSNSEESTSGCNIS